MRTSTLETNQHYHAWEETNNSKEIKNELASSVTKGKYRTKYKVVLKLIINQIQNLKRRQES